MTVAESEIDRKPADRLDLRSHVPSPRNKVAARFLDVLLVGLVGLALMGIVGGLRGARADGPGVRAAEQTSSGSNGAAAAPPAQDGLPIGEAVTVGGYTVTVAAAGFEQTLGSEFVGKGYLLVSLDVVDSAGKAQPYDATQWSLQKPDGQVVQPTDGLLPPVKPSSRDDDRRLPVQAAFEVGAQRGDFYVVYGSGSGREGQAWKVTI